VSKIPNVALLCSLWIVSAVFCRTAPAASKSISASPDVDTTTAHKLYLDGDFDKAISLLEGAITANKLLSHQDSVFTFKHLGVMYAANDATRERGKHYMYQLLAIEPTARIMDMFASDMIYMIFKNIQEEFATTQSGRRPGGSNAAQASAASETVPPPKTDIAPSSSESSGKKWLFWSAGGVAAAAGIGLTLYLMQDEPRPQRKLNVD
jgi:hypothetical protein